ncbi:MAG: sugar kinase [Flavobacteriales bacterium]|nr:sugar kinase [Flavobacteriales bacterium]
MSLLVLGTVAFDTIETSFGKAEKILGGAATFTSITSSYFTKPDILSIVGYDFPNKYIELLKSYNINITGLDVHKTEKTFFWSGKYHENMNIRDTIDTQLNVLKNFDPIIPEEINNPDFLMLGNVVPSVQLNVFNQINKKPKLVAMDTMNLWIDNCHEDLIKVIKKVDILMINDQEILELHQENDINLAISKSFELGLEYIIVKMGSEGALLISKMGQKFKCPAVEIEHVVDPTGAGDSFAGGFMGYIAAKNSHTFDDLKNAVRWGTVMASFCVENFGTKNIIGIDESSKKNRFNSLV